MKLIDLLRKLGILRFGWTAGIYKNGRSRPFAFMMDDVHDDEKDLWLRKDLALPAARGRKVLFWFALTAAVVLACLFLLTGGVSLWLFCLLGLWGATLTVVFQCAFQGRYSPGGVLALTVFATLASIVLLGLTAAG